ncbi:MAG: hypothetical protein OXI77_15440 [Chloroflexota bacterium]|nr:hypothetical protein [Chloroflexota bacterium]MDE2910336.1 hypothetical protein [Chloroflexota bacterium]
MTLALPRMKATRLPARIARFRLYRRRGNRYGKWRASFRVKDERRFIQTAYG